MRRFSFLAAVAYAAGGGRYLVSTVLGPVALSLVFHGQVSDGAAGKDFLKMVLDENLRISRSHNNKKVVKEIIPSTTAAPEKTTAIAAVVDAAKDPKKDDEDQAKENEEENAKKSKEESDAEDKLPYRIFKKKKIKLKPLHVKNGLPAQRFVNQKIIAPTDLNAVPDVPGTRRIEHRALLQTFVNDPAVKLIPQRVDAVPPLASILANEMRTAAVVYFSGSEGAAAPLGACVLDPRSNLQSLVPLVEAWCGQLFSWLGAQLHFSIPKEQQPLRLDIVLVKELACSTIETKRYLGQVVWNHESLWGRIDNIDHLPITAEMHNFLRQWSRVALLQSRRVNRAYRDYIINQYALIHLAPASHKQAWVGVPLHQVSRYALSAVNPVPEAAAYYRGHPPVCAADTTVLLQANALRNAKFKVIYPTDFDWTRPYMHMMPACLATYPVNTLLSFIDPRNNQERVEICDINRGFVLA